MLSGQYIKYVSVWCGLVILLWWMPPQRVYAEIYKYVENGVVHFTNLEPYNRTYQVIRDSTISSANQITNATPPAALQDPLPFLNTIYQIAQAYQLNPDLIKAIIKVESNYNSRAVSPKGAQGLMQLMPATAKRFGVSDVFDPEENIRGGVKFLRHLFNEFGEDNLDLVLAGYNAGEEAVRKYGNKIPPYAETRRYVKKVKELYLPFAQYQHPRLNAIFRYVDENGVITFTNVQRVN